ncbi:hypothetical protein K439DRAFT_506926 [Ramaria rubella]|nr:hypothetical protein K439DRAFT_506926 [Ramaria rubella]
MHATRFLPAPGTAVESEAFVDKLRGANEELLGHARRHGGAVSGAYAEFVEEWCGPHACGAGLGPHLRKYLMGCLQSLGSSSGSGHGHGDHGTGRVLAAHVRVLSGRAEGLAEAVARGRKYTRRMPRDAEVWIARLDAEEAAGEGQRGLLAAWGEARAQVDGPGTERVWAWGLRDGWPRETWQVGRSISACG